MTMIEIRRHEEQVYLHCNLQRHRVFYFLRAGFRFEPLAGTPAVSRAEV